MYTCYLSLSLSLLLFVYAIGFRLLGRVRVLGFGRNNPHAPWLHLYEVMEGNLA